MYDIGYDVIELRNITIDVDFGYLGKSGIEGDPNTGTNCNTLTPEQHSSTNGILEQMSSGNCSSKLGEKTPGKHKILVIQEDQVKSPYIYEVDIGKLTNT